jgi:hypothetical protein
MGRFNCIFLKAVTIGFFLPLSISTLSVSARAYPTPVDFDGSISRWNLTLEDDPVTYELKSDNNSDILVYSAALDDAAALWSNVSSSFFRYERASESGEDAKVTINLQSSLDGEAYSAGYALYDEIDNNGPVHCSVYVSIGGDESYNGIAKTLLHELGHCVGLGHSVIPESIMSYQLSKNAFALDIDDEAAISRLYPADGSNPKLPPGCAVGSFVGKTGGTIFTKIFLLIWLLVPVCLTSKIFSNAMRRAFE